VQDAGVEAIVRGTAADADHGGIGELILEDREHQLAVVLLEHSHGIVEQDPARLVQEQARESQALLLIQ
jgi:hypothetical protein